MIRPLRQRHRHISLALGAVLPILFIVGIAARRPVPSLEALPSDLSGPEAVSTTITWDRSDLFAKVPVQVRLQRDTNTGGRFAFQFSAPPEFLKPDLLVYWVAQGSKTNETIPDNAVLLGAFGSAQALVTEKESKSEGRLLLYSLANQEIVAESKPFQFP